MIMTKRMIEARNDQLHQQNKCYLPDQVEESVGFCGSTPDYNCLTQGRVTREKDYLEDCGDNITNIHHTVTY